VREPQAGAERAVVFLPLRTHIHVDRPSTFDPNVGPVLAVNEHAIERLFQRLNVLEPAAVREELHDAIFMAVTLANAAGLANLHQVVLPTRSGAFLCSVEAEGLVARTWIARSETACRHTVPARIAKEYFAASGGEQGFAAAVGELPLQASLSLIEPAEGMAEALGQVAWLREPYTRRADPIGDAWRNARSQQLQQSIAC
jgi:hypothetical protein